MTYKYKPLSAPVALKEIERKLAGCSIFCEHHGDCPFCVSLDTVNPNLAVDVCLRPDKMTVAVKGGSQL